MPSAASTSAAYLKAVVRAVKRRNLGPPCTNIGRAGSMADSHYRLLRLFKIGRDDHGEWNERGRQRQVFDRLRAGAVLADSDAPMTGHALHVQATLRLRHGSPQLVEAAARQERREARNERRLSGGGEASGDVHHVGLRHAHAHPAVGIPVAKLVPHGRNRKVRVDRENVHAFLD
jgi:hypothetical protein